MRGLLLLSTSLAGLAAVKLPLLSSSEEDEEEEEAVGREAVELHVGMSKDVALLSLLSQVAGSLLPSPETSIKVSGAGGVLIGGIF